jgi:hypothetical protein
VTENTITVNAKFIRPMTILNLARLIMSSNKEDGINIDIKSGDRRTEAVIATQKYLEKRYNFAFWKFKCPIYKRSV